MRFCSPRTATIAACGLLLVGGAVLAQHVDGVSKGFAPSSGGSFEVGGVDVDVTAKTADAARYGGWRIAQRKGFALLARRLGSSVTQASDGTLDAIVTGIIVENEEIGPNRYIARLGVTFDRGRAAAILGVGGAETRSPPMLLIPVEYSGGAAQAFEQKSAWLQAWARFRTGNSAIDYVRATGTGADSLLLNAAQTGRRGRDWWRSVLHQYGAIDVLVPEVRLYRQWPGGPIIGVFTARHGPDGTVLGRYTLRVGSSASLPALLDAGIARIDDAYETALNEGTMRVDVGLGYRPPPPVEDTPDDELLDNAQDVVTEPQGAAVTVQFDTANASAVTAAEASITGVPGVRSAITTSLALGGVSVMRVVFDGDSAALKSALEARGWIVQEGGGTLRIRRPLLLTMPPAGSDVVTGG